MRNLVGILVIVLAFGIATSSGKNKKEQVAPVEPSKPIVTPEPGPTPKPSPLKPVLELLDFGGDWCEWCKKQDYIVRGIEADGIRVHRHDKGTPEARKYGVTSFPTYVILRNGKEIDRVVGSVMQAELRRKVGLDKPIPSLLPTPTNSPAVGPKGYRLRLFYPEGDAAGAKLAKMIPRRMPVITKQYGFDHDTTGSIQAESWAGIPKDKLTLLLVDASDRIVYYQHEFSHEAAVLREELRAAAAGTLNVAGDCPSKIPSKPASTQ